MRYKSFLVRTALLLLAGAGVGTVAAASEFAPAWVYSVLPWSVIDTDVEPEQAEVWLDGDRIGIADRFDGWPEKLEVAPGPHRIEFRLDGYRTLRIDLDAEPGRFYRFERTLRRAGDPAAGLPGGAQDEIVRPPADAWIRLVIIEPADAAIYLDGARFDPASIDSRSGTIRLDPGKHLIELVRPGYETLKAEIELAAGETRALRLRLERSPTR